MNAHAVAMLIATAAVFVLGATSPLAVITAVSFAYVFVQRKREKGHESAVSRYAHQLTLLRLLLLCYAAWNITTIDAELLLGIFSANVVLDVIDGRIARHLDQATAFGMVFDREVDGIYVLVASLYFFLAADIPAWILVPGLLPYAYRLVAWALGNPDISARKQPHAAFLAGANFVLILLAVAMTGQGQLIVLVISTAIVTLSFLVSFWELVRFRNESPVL